MTALPGTGSSHVAECNHMLIDPAVHHKGRSTMDAGDGRFLKSANGQRAGDLQHAGHLRRGNATMQPDVRCRHGAVSTRDDRLFGEHEEIAVARWLCEIGLQPRPASSRGGGQGAEGNETAQCLS